MQYENGKFVEAKFFDGKKNEIMAVWEDKFNNTRYETVIEASSRDKGYQKLLETFSIDDIQQQTDEYNTKQEQMFLQYVKEIADFNGLIYDPESAEPNSRLIIDHLFALPNGTAGQDLLFEIKLKIFDLPAIINSDNDDLKQQLREADTVLESFYIAGKFLFE
jgi:hypothetical protein